MIKFEPSPYLKQRPAVQMTSMIDIMFIILLFFMALFVYFNFETQLDISVPKAKSSADATHSSGEIVINITKDGTIFVNDKKVSLDGLTALLKRTAEWYPEQAVIVRADEKTYHAHVVQVLDACARAKVWNISFATTKEQ